ncbi:tetratricopeptide repeat protein [Pectinatus frisingensis]|uniref:tetratricopeptide repeat protein n=1 Tax=Pectinatus frisingensis TaxID=865 RepID=UPI0018C5D836|nr:tetratricopeptide repeat protein [Pectinatus frisingensis]
MKKILPIIFFTCMFIFSPISSAAIYVNNENGYSIDLPNGWSLEQESEQITNFSNAQKMDLKIITKPSNVKAHSPEYDLANLYYNTKQINQISCVNIRPDLIANQIAVCADFSQQENTKTYSDGIIAQFYYNNKLYILLFSGKQQQKEAMENDANKILKSMKFMQKSSFELYTDGQQETAQKNYEAASVDYKKALELTSNYTGAMHQLAYNYSETGEYTKAIDIMTSAINIQPNDPEYYSERGYAYFNTNDSIDAISDFSKAIELDNKEAHYYGGLGNAYAQQNNYQAAITAFEKQFSLSAKSGNSAEAQFNLAQCYEKLGYRDKALEQYNAVLKSQDLPAEIKAKAEVRINNNWSILQEWL